MRASCTKREHNRRSVVFRDLGLPLCLHTLIEGGPPSHSFLFQDIRFRQGGKEGPQSTGQTKL